MTKINILFVFLSACLTELIYSIVNKNNNSNVLKKSVKIKDMDSYSVYTISENYIEMNFILSFDKNIIYCKNLYNILSDLEYNAINAHEEYHLQQHHPIKKQVLKITTQLLGFIMIAIVFRAYSIVIKLLFIIIYFISVIVTHLINHYFEYFADNYAITKMGETQTLISALVKINKLNLDRRSYIILNNSHPNLDKRIKNMQLYFQKTFKENAK